jgi:glycosyltransferase involved in cell wall biosynthesis
MTPRVDVLMPTYNHARYVAQAIESVLAQEAGFAYRLVVADDCSTDGTQDIIRSYAARHPDAITAVFAPKHIGIISEERLSFKVLEQCHAEFVALLEGDDYWADPRKLQKQVAFLDRRPDCAIVFHDALTVFEDGSQEPRRMCPPGLKEISTLETILRGNFIPTCSVLFRRGLFGEIPRWMYTLLMGDWPLHILNAEHGDIGYIDETMAVYRVHGRGLWSSRSYLARVEGEVRVYDALRKHFGRDRRALILDCLRERLGILAGGYDVEGDLEKSETYTRRYVSEMLRAGQAPGWRFTLALLRLSAPPLYVPLRQLKRALVGAGRRPRPAGTTDKH